MPPKKEYSIKYLSDKLKYDDRLINNNIIWNYFIYHKDIVYHIYDKKTKSNDEYIKPKYYNIYIDMMQDKIMNCNYLEDNKKDILCVILNECKIS